MTIVIVIVPGVGAVASPLLFPARRLMYSVVSLPLLLLLVVVMSRAVTVVFLRRVVVQKVEVIGCGPPCPAETDRPSR